MLTQLDFHDHSTNQLVEFFDNYLEAVKKLPKGTSFDESFCPDKNLRKYIKVTEDGEDGELKKKFINFHKSFLDLDTDGRNQFLKIFKETNDFPWILKNPSRAVKKNNYPGATGKACHALLCYLFENTLPLKPYNIKSHYAKFHENISNNWCPFCGMELYKEPTRYREDYDHILFKKEYPASAITMKNLVPTGDKCNRIYKKEVDVLQCLGKPTKIAYSYTENIKPKLSLKGSDIQSKPRIWKVSVAPNNEKVKAWNKIYKIDQRCLEDFLTSKDPKKKKPQVDIWIDQLVQLCQIEKDHSGNQPWTLDKLKIKLQALYGSLENYYFQDMNMIRLGLYDFLLNHVDTNYQTSLVSRINQK